MTVNGLLRTFGFGRVPNVKRSIDPKLGARNSQSFRSFLHKWWNFRCKKLNAIGLCQAQFQTSWLQSHGLSLGLPPTLRGTHSCRSITPEEQERWHRVRLLME